MIPAISNLYEELPEDYFVNEMFGVGRVDVIKLRPTYSITAELADDIAKIFAFANAQGIHGKTAGSLEFDISHDMKSPVVNVTCSVAKSRI